MRTGKSRHFNSKLIARTPAREDNLKACFDSIYIQEAPHEYYRVLYGLDYIIPELAKGIFRNASRELERLRGRRIKVLDLGCSYGNNSILLRHPLDFHRLAQRYADLAHYDLSTEQIIELDRHYFQSWPRDLDVHCIGFDASAPALSYAEAVGAIDGGIVADLEHGELSPEQRAMLRDVDLIISSGCVGYITATTFAKILDAIEGPKPWLAVFVLRMYSYAAIEDELARRGLVTEKLDGVTFVQRRFHSAQECESVLTSLARMGIATQDKEDEGLLHAEFMLTRPPEDIQSVPMAHVASVSKGTQYAFGRRYRRDRENTLRLTR